MLPLGQGAIALTLNGPCATHGASMAGRPQTCHAAQPPGMISRIMPQGSVLSMPPRGLPCSPMPQHRPGQLRQAPIMATPLPDDIPVLQPLTLTWPSFQRPMQQMQHAQLVTLRSIEPMPVFNQGMGNSSRAHTIATQGDPPSPTWPTQQVSMPMRVNRTLQTSMSIQMQPKPQQIMPMQMQPMPQPMPQPMLMQQMPFVGQNMQLQLMPKPSSETIPAESGKPSSERSPRAVEHPRFEHPALGSHDSVLVLSKACCPSCQVNW